MQRREFLHYGVMGTAVMVFPQLLSGQGEFKKMVKGAIYCSKLNPVRFVAGLVFDEVKEVYLKPLVKSAFNEFVNGKSLPKSSLAYYDSGSVLSANSIAHEPYKASVVVYGVADYELYKQKEVRLELKRSYDKDRFIQIQQYLKDTQAQLQLYNRDMPFVAGSDLEPNDLFNLDYIVFKSHQQKHYQNLLEVTNNRIFGELVV